MNHDQPQIPQDSPESIEASKLEWRAVHTFLTSDQVKNKISELNSNLATGEKSWRLPTVAELQEGLEKNSEVFIYDSYWCQHQNARYPGASWEYVITRDEIRMVFSPDDSSLCLVR